MDKLSCILFLSSSSRSSKSDSKSGSGSDSEKSSLQKNDSSPEKSSSRRHDSDLKQVKKNSPRSRQNSEVGDTGIVLTVAVCPIQAAGRHTSPTFYLGSWGISYLNVDRSIIHKIIVK